MHRVGRWLSSGSRTTSSSNLDAVIEAQNMEVALKAAELIMDDDIQGAEQQLANGDSAFHKLARGTLGFMKATLGFEQEIMKQATEMLADAENTAYNFHQKALYDNSGFTSTIYDRGSEFALCQAEAQMMAAVVGVLNESITESLKGFYKMRKAYYTLDSLAQQEQKFMKTRAARGFPMSRQQSSESVRSVRSVQSVNSTRPTLAINTVQPTTPIHPSHLRSAVSAANADKEMPESDGYFEIDHANPRTSHYKGHLGKVGEPSPVEEKMHYLDVSKDGSPPHSGANTPMSGTYTPNLPPIDPDKPALLTLDADSEIFSNSLDVFIHSGVNLMSGLINLMLSVVPPAFSRLLSIVGFRGDRQRGLQMLWQAAKFSNANGGMAGLILFAWYNGLNGFCDIVTDSDPSIADDVHGFPLERLTKLLATMRGRYPSSYLWKLEEARMYSSRRQLSKGIEILTRPGEKSQLKQLEALAMFELSLDSMNAHQYALCAKSFLNCIDLNEWSPALYHYAAAAAYLQIYRDAKLDPTKEAVADEHRKLAVKHFKEAPLHVGKKKMMGKQLPFDTFVSRKVAKWTARAAAWNVDFVDAIGVSPIDEVSLLWNGFKKMDEAQLQTSLSNLLYSEDPQKNPHWHREELDEKAILAILRATILRNLRRHDEATSLLQSVILSHGAAEFKGFNKDEWTAPSAHYEMAVNFWMQRREYRRRYGMTLAGVEADDGKMPPESDFRHDAGMVAEAKRWLEKAKGWGPYELDTRIGIKITAGYSAVVRWEAKHKDLVK